MNEHLSTHRTESLIPLIQTRQLEGRDHLVVPVIPILEGVGNDYLIPAEEIAAFVEAWNGIPLPLGHPMEGGRFISANRPDIIEKCPGRFFHANMDGGKLKGEMWIDIAKCEAMGGDALEVLTRLRDRKPLEVSTAFWSEDEMTPGTFSGKTYKGIRRKLRPDHLALLPHEKGAFSWEDGAGAPRVNAQEQPTMKEKIYSAFSALASALGIKVNEITEEPIGGGSTEPATNTQKEDPKVDPTKPEEKSAAAPPATPPAASATSELKIPDGMALVTNEQKAFLDAALAAQAVHKAALIQEIVTNSKDTITKAALEAMDIPTLAALAKMSKPIPAASYAGAAGIQTHATDAGAFPVPPAIFTAPPDK